MTDQLKERSPAPAVAPARHAHPVRTMAVDIAAPDALYYGIRAAGGGVWLALARQSWDELWQQLPPFRRIWRICTVIWGTAILADAVIRVVVAVALPISA